MRIATASPRTPETRFLTAIISTVASSLELEEVLEAVVRLLSEASAVHACFVYLLEDEGRRLVLQAAPEPYAHLVGRIGLEHGQGLAWWALERREPAFIRENAFADPRFAYVPELGEEHFQSLVSIPLLAPRDGRPIGAVTLHTEAPREFTKAEVDFLVSSATLVAGAIENARVYEEARNRVAELEALTELGEAIARAETLDELLAEVVRRSAPLLAASSCHVYLLDSGSEELRLGASWPPTAGAAERLALSELGPQLARGARSTRVAAPLVANEELLGLLKAQGTGQVDLARAVASQTAVAIKKIHVIERLAEKNLTRDFFEALATGAPIATVEGKAARLRCELDQRSVVLAASPPGDELERALSQGFPGALLDRRDESLRAIVRVPAGGPEALLAEVRRLHGELGSQAAIGVSGVCVGAASFRAGFEEARSALLGASVLRQQPGVVAYDELGAYKYLLRMSRGGDVRDGHREAVARLAAYDRQRSTALLATLEEFLRRHGNISATAEALYVHPNTLRQRLRRVMELSGIDLRRDDWLAVEIAVKLVRLEQALATGDTRPPARL